MSYDECNHNPLDTGAFCEIINGELVYWCCGENRKIKLNKFWRKAVEKERVKIK